MKKKTSKTKDQPLTFESWLKESIYEMSDRLKRQHPEFREQLLKVDRDLAIVEKKICRAKIRAELDQLYSEESRLYSTIQMLDNRSPITHAVVYSHIKDIVESMKSNR